MTAVRPFADSVREYERWLRKQLRGDLWEDDLAYKHERMRESPFVFLRATYWRWAESILTVCPDLADAPIVPAVGDVHLENYGVWRDIEGRLAWGINDLDEAAEMPFALDLVRLAASAMLCRVSPRDDARRICGEVLDGYRQGLERPRPFSLDEKRLWLRSLFAVPERERTRFWKRIDRLQPDDTIPRRFRRAIEARLPGDDHDAVIFARRPRAGVGSLGRPRWVGIARWRGGRVVREAKAVVPSGWSRMHSRGVGTSATAIVDGRYRAQDPWYTITDDVVVRRLSPNSRKIEGTSRIDLLLQPEMLHAMGFELANIHLGGANLAHDIGNDVRCRGRKWLEHAALSAADFVAADFGAYVRS